MRTPPWERNWLRLTPEGFERMVVAFLRRVQGSLEQFDVTHREQLSGADGEFEIDAVARFEALGGEYLVLVECKHHKSRVKREHVQVLADRIRSLRAQKGMLFCTGGFQSGAIEYAAAQRIALVHFTEGGPVYETKAQGGPVGPNREYDAYVVYLSETGGPSYHMGGYDDLTDYLFGHSTSTDGGGEPGREEPA